MTGPDQSDSDRPICTCCGAPVCRCLASVPAELRYCRACRALGLHRVKANAEYADIAKARIQAMMDSQAGRIQTCAFCGTEYWVLAGEQYRPGAVCVSCWPRVAAIESDATS